MLLLRDRHQTIIYQVFTVIMSGLSTDVSSHGVQCLLNAGPASQTVAKLWINVWPTTIQQTRDVDPILISCWASVCDAGPARNHNRVNATYLPDGCCWHCSGSWSSCCIALPLDGACRIGRVSTVATRTRTSVSASDTDTYNGSIDPRHPDKYPALQPGQASRRQWIESSGILWIVWLYLDCCSWDN